MKFDVIDQFMLAFEIEEQLHIELTDDQLAEFELVSDVIEAVSTALAVNAEENKNAKHT